MADDKKTVHIQAFVSKQALIDQTQKMGFAC